MPARTLAPAPMGMRCSVPAASLHLHPGGIQLDLSPVRIIDALADPADLAAVHVHRRQDYPVLVIEEPTGTCCDEQDNNENELLHVEWALCRKPANEVVG